MLKQLSGLTLIIVLALGAQLRAEEPQLATSEPGLDLATLNSPTEGSAVVKKKHGRHHRHTEKKHKKQARHGKKHKKNLAKLDRR